MQKAIRELKSVGGITIRFPIVEWSGNEMAIEVHGDDGNILTQGGSTEEIGICGFLIEKAHKENIDKDA